MLFPKIIPTLLAIATVSQPAITAKSELNPDDPAPVAYSFSYDVQDARTGDSKSHVESRQGDVVKGRYALDDPDGTRRIVEYAADPVNGFTATVRKEALKVEGDRQPVERDGDDSVVVEAVPNVRSGAVADRPATAAVNSFFRFGPGVQVVQAAPVVSRLSAPFTYAIF